VSGKAQSEVGQVVRDHRRQWRRCRYVYPVISRRAGGLSIGVNLNPDKQCNFSCVYCQIDRHIPRNLHHVDIAALGGELREAMSAALSGDLWTEERFAATPEALRRLNDIAFSGDGEPTCLEQFPGAVAVAAEVRREFAAEAVKLVVITNASLLDSPQVRKALPLLDAHNGEIWAKLDAGTEERFAAINRPCPGLTLERIARNILGVALAREVVIQTLLFRLDGSPPAPEEIDAYCARLRYILGNGGRIKLVQLHTLARPPAEARASALSNEELAAAAERIRAALNGLDVRTYGGAEVVSGMSVKNDSERTPP